MTTHAPLDAVTGAFTYTGASITDELIRRGRRVRTLTGHPDRAPASGTPLEIRPLDFADKVALRHSLEGVDTLYNTYWVRFAHGSTTFDTAVDNSRRLFTAAAGAGVRRIVHVSITHPDSGSPYPYFRGKAVVEDHLTGTGISHAIARPAFLFGRDGVLINNVAWMLRHLPVVAVGDGGGYWVRGIHVDDLATLCVDLGEQGGDVTVDAVGPERMTFRTLVGHVRDAVARKTPIVSVPGWALPPLTTAIGVLLRDRLLTSDEYNAMADGLADSQAPTNGQTRFTDWLAANAESLGRRYTNDTRRHLTPAEPASPGSCSHD
jgi:NADH dehydrogenase